MRNDQLQGSSVSWLRCKASAFFICRYHSQPTGAFKIGDFGLAKFKGAIDELAEAATPATQGEHRPPRGADATISASEPTGVVGTKLYTAPEIEQGLPHNAKVSSPTCTYRTELFRALQGCTAGGLISRLDSCSYLAACRHHHRRTCTAWASSRSSC